MAIIVLKDAVVTINGVDLSDHITQVEISITREEVETTTFGTSGGRHRIAGLEDSSFSFTFLQDYDTAKVDATLFPLRGSTTTVVVKTAATVSATQPSYSGTVLVTEYMPIANAIGDAPEISVEWPVNGTITRGTA